MTILQPTGREEPSPRAAVAVPYDYAQTVEDVGRLVWDQILLWIRVQVALRAFESLDERNSRTLGLLERLIHQMVQDRVFARDDELDVSPTIANLWTPRVALLLC